MRSSLSRCHNISDFRDLARRRLPGPIFHYIDGGADDEVTLRRNTEAFEQRHLVPRILVDVAEVDLGVTVLGQKMAMPLFCSPTALQRLFHTEGERAVAAAAEKFGVLFGISSLGTYGLEEIGAQISTPKMFQFYFHKDRGLNTRMLERAKASGFEVLTLTVDTAAGGNRERDMRTGFTSPPELTVAGLMSFALHPGWTLDYLTGPKFKLSQLETHVQQGSNIAISVSEYFSTLLDPSLNWSDVEKLRQQWDGPFCLKGVMSAQDARRAADAGIDGLMVSNHGGRQLDGAACPFEQITEIVDAVGDRLDVICDGGVRRGSHVLKALALGAKACSGGRFYLYALAGAGQAGVERALELMRKEMIRDMKLMGCQSVDQLNRADLRP